MFTCLKRANAPSTDAAHGHVFAACAASSAGTDASSGLRRALAAAANTAIAAGLLRHGSRQVTSTVCTSADGGSGRCSGPSGGARGLILHNQRCRDGLSPPRRIAHRPQASIAKGGQHEASCAAARASRTKAEVVKEGQAQGQEATELFRCRRGRGDRAGRLASTAR